MNQSVQRKSVSVGDCYISYLEAGPETGPVALLIHGIPACSELWRGVMEIIGSKGWRCLAPDLPGYGGTIIPDNGDYSVQGASKMLADWIEQEDLKNIWLVGHDIGGGVSQLLITRCEERFKKFTLSNCITANTWPVKEIRMTIKLAKLGLFNPLAVSGLFTLFARKGLREAVANKSVLTKNVVERVFWDSKVSSKEGRRKFQRMLTQLDPAQTMDNMAALAKIKVPVELVWGLKDKNQPWDNPGRILRETFPTAKIQTLEGAAHFLQIDSTRDYAEALLSEK